MAFFGPFVSELNHLFLRGAEEIASGHCWGFEVRRAIGQKQHAKKLINPREEKLMDIPTDKQTNKVDQQSAASN